MESTLPPCGRKQRKRSAATATSSTKGHITHVRSPSCGNEAYLRALPRAVNKRNGITKTKHGTARFRDEHDEPRMEFYGIDARGLPNAEHLKLEISDNVVKVCKIYLKRCLLNDCKLVRLNPNYVEHIVDLIFNLGLVAKRGHFRRDILGLINLVEVPECMLNALGMNRNHRVAIFKGIAFKAELAHPNMASDMKQARVLLVSRFSTLEDGGHTDRYDTIPSLKRESKTQDVLIDRAAKAGVQLIVAEQYLPYDVAERLAKRDICCIHKVGKKTMNMIAFALGRGILKSLNAEDNLKRHVGTCEHFNLLAGPQTIASMRFAEHFKGFSILVSTRVISAENLNRIKELIKISIVRLQGIAEELELIKNLDGTFIVDTNLFDEEFRDSNSICENLSDYLDMLLGNTSRTSATSSSPRSNLNYFSCDIYYNKIVESEITCSEYRKLTRLQCFKYYTKINELCMKPTFETVPIGNYAEGLFLSDFIAHVTNALKVNKCTVNPNCTDSFINHQLHFETAYSNVENMRLSMSFQISSEKHRLEDGIKLKTFCTACNHSQMHVVQDLTLGRFLQLMLFNRSYRAKCDHVLFAANKFSVLADNYAISFSHSPVSIYTIVPEFNEPLYNCARDTVPFSLTRRTPLDRRLRGLANRVTNLIHGVKLAQCGGSRVFPNLHFPEEGPLAQSLSFFYERVLENVRRNFRNLVSYDVERHLPCICQIAAAHSPESSDRSQWLRPLRNLSFAEFTAKFERHSAFGIELNYRLHEKLKAALDSGQDLHTCDNCRAESYTTLGDVDVLNWLYVLVHVVNALESKLTKLKAGLSHVMKHCEALRRLHASVHRTERDLIGTYQQCLALIIYSKYFCPRDPMHLFMPVKAFFAALFSLFERLAVDCSAVSHLDAVANFKIIEYDKSSVVVCHSFGAEASSYEKIDFIRGTASPLEGGLGSAEELYTIYSVEEFLTFSQYFAILSGIQDLASEPAKKSAYFKLVSKIRTRTSAHDSIACPKYEPVTQPERDVANIVARALVSRQYTARMGVTAHTPRFGVAEHLSLLAACEPDYEPYRFEGSTPTCERKGLAYNYVAVARLRGTMHWILGLAVKLRAHADFASEILIREAKLYVAPAKLATDATTDPGFPDVVGAKAEGARSARPPEWQCPPPFYGTPVVYSNAKLVKYRRLGNAESSTSSAHATFIAKCIELGVDSRMLVRRVLRGLRSGVTETMQASMDANKLVSLASAAEARTCRHSERYSWAHSAEKAGQGEAGSAHPEAESRTDPCTFEVYVGPYCVTVYHAHGFQKLRRKFCGDDLNFARALCRCTRMPSIGKSGSPIFMSYDGRFTLKLINKHEMGLMTAKGGDFFKYFDAHKTLMSLPYGLFKITHLKTNSTINCFVMQNIDYFGTDSKITFDIKGVALKRYISLSQDFALSFNQNFVMAIVTHSSLSRQSSVRSDYTHASGISSASSDSGAHSTGCVLLDQNFKMYTKGCPIQLDHDSMNVLTERLRNDLSFLSSINIVDYSLLLRIMPAQGVITLGLIDFLRPYTWDKQIETVGKRLANIGQAPTIVSPNEYRTRFSNFIQNVFIYPYAAKGQKDSQATRKQRKPDMINFTYQIREHAACKLCRLLKTIYANNRLTCLKYYMGLMSPETAEYLHLAAQRRSRGDQERPRATGDLDALARTIERTYQSPTIHWNCA